MPNKPVTLYLDHSAPPPVVPVSLGDSDWTFQFTVMYNGNVYAPTVSKVIMTGHKPDGNVVAFTGSKSGNVFSVTPASVQLTAVAGIVACELRLIASNGRSVGTGNFLLQVEEGPEGTVTVASSSSLSAYTTILNQLQQIMSQASTIPSDIAGYISDWLEAHISGSQAVAVDDTLTVSGAAADAKETGDRIAAIYTDIGVEESGALRPAGSLDAIISNSGTVQSSTVTKAFYVPVEPNTTYKIITDVDEISESGYAHFVGQFSKVPSVGDSCTQYSYTTGTPERSVTITTGASTTYLLFGHGGWKTDEHMRVTSGESSGKTLGQRVADLESKTIETDNTLSIEGAAADAKAAGDAIVAAKAEILSQMGMDEETTAEEITAAGSVDALVNNTGLLQASTATKAFYAQCEPNTRYAFSIVPKGALDWDKNAHFFAEFTDASLSAGASQSENFIYSAGGKPDNDIFLTTSENAKWIVWGHGTIKDTALFQVTNLDKQSTNLVKINAAKMQWEHGGLSTEDGSEIVNNARLRMKRGVKASKGSEVTAGEREYIWALYSDSASSFCIAHATDFVSGAITLSESGYLRIAVKNDTEITADVMSDIISDVSIKVKKADIQSAMLDDYIKSGGFASSSASRKLEMGNPYVYHSAPIEDEILDSTTVDDLYAIYDGLVSSYPELAARLPDIGNTSAASGSMPLRLYQIGWQQPWLVSNEASWSAADNHYNLGPHAPRLFINAGTHGNEKASAYGVALAIQEIVTSDEDWARYIRGNFILEICPVANPSGYNRTTRNNADGIDINRTFLTRTAPESQALYQHLKNGGYHAYIDSHNSGGNGNYFGITDTNPWLHDYIMLNMKLGGIVFHDWKALSAGEQYAVSPYLQCWSCPAIGMFQDMATELGVPGYLIESVGVYAASSGTLTPNHKKYCKFTKDLLINSIIVLGSNDWD